LQPNIFSKFAIGAVGTGGNLPPVSTILAKLGAKFAAGVVDTGGNLPLMSLTLAANFPTVSLIPVVHLD
jgi:hypothetical protein